MSLLLFFLFTVLLFKIFGPIILGIFLLSCRGGRLINGLYLASILKQILHNSQYKNPHNTFHNNYGNSANHENSANKMSLQEAREILGVDANANRDEIKKNYLNLMKKIHPDAGGSSYLAQKVNQAKDLLMQ